jgi:hypothetical protein
MAQVSLAVPRVVTLTPAAPRAALESPAAPRAAAAPPTITDGPPPREWPVFSDRLHQATSIATPSVLMGPASTTPDRRPPMTVPVTPLVNPHQMVTRAKAGFWVLPDRLVLAASTSPSTLSSILTSVCAVLDNPNWRTTMEDEYRALMSNGTWELVSWPCGSNIVTGKWLSMHKLRADGSFDRYKAH